MPKKSEKLERRSKKLAAFVRFAIELGELSTCLRLKVGCVIVPEDFSTILSIGYNGPPAGEPNNSCRGETPCGCIHAEANALVKMRTTSRGLTLITTKSPCEHCAGLILNSGAVSKVVYVDDYRDSSGLELLLRSAVTVERFSQ